MKKLILIFLFSVFSLNVYAEVDCSQDLRSLTPEQARECRENSELKLIETYEALIVEFKKLNNGSDGLLEEAQRAWTTMRDANCRIVNRNIPTNDIYTGTNAARAKMICEVIMNRERIGFMSIFLP